MLNNVKKKKKKALPGNWFNWFNWFTKFSQPSFFFFCFNNKRVIFFSVKRSEAGFALQSLIIVSSVPAPLKSNMEQAAQHKRLACVLFLDLYLKRSLSEYEGERQPLRAAGTCAAFLLSRWYIWGLVRQRQAEMVASRVTSLCCVNGRWAFICQYLTHGRRCGSLTHRRTIKRYNARWGRTVTEHGIKYSFFLSLSVARKIKPRARWNYPS